MTTGLAPRTLYRKLIGLTVACQLATVQVLECWSQQSDSPPEAHISSRSPILFPSPSKTEFDSSNKASISASTLSAAASASSSADCAATCYDAVIAVARALSRSTDSDALSPASMPASMPANWIPALSPDCLRLPADPRRQDRWRWQSHAP